MKIIKNEKLIERNGKIGNWISLGALAVLGIGMYLSLQKPEWFMYALLCLILGFTMTQIGMYMGARWGRSPRPDEKIDAALKGLHSDFNLYHYATPASHLLVGPAGIWVILPYHQGGKIRYDGKRWKLSGGGFLQGYMRIFGQEGLGRPDAEAQAEINMVKKHLEKNLGEFTSAPEVNALLVFTNESLELDAGDSPFPAMKLKQAKEFLRQQSKNRVLSAAEIDRIKEIL